jgi:hypothetical protein
MDWSSNMKREEPQQDFLSEGTEYKQHNNSIQRISISRECTRKRYQVAV